MPWEMTVEMRKRQSKDPRIQKQVADEAQWDNTIVSGVWQSIRKVAKPAKDFVMDREEMLQLLTSCGICSVHLSNKLLATLDPKKKACYNGLVLCKLIEMSLLSPKTQDAFVRHAFNKFDRPALSDAIRKDDIRKCELQCPADSKASKKSGARKKSTLPLTQKSGATYEMVMGLRTIFSTLVTQDASQLAYEEFKQCFLQPENAWWTQSFMGAFFECMAAYYAPPLGELPIVPLRWLNTIEPIQEVKELYDADVLLLREIEELGYDPFVGAQNKKKKGKPKAEK